MRPRGQTGRKTGVSVHAAGFFSLHLTFSDEETKLDRCDESSKKVMRCDVWGSAVICQTTCSGFVLAV